MARIDDYINARELAVQKLKTEAFHELIQRSGFEAPDGSIIRVPFLDRTYRIEYPDFSFTDESDDKKEIPVQEQVLILHYLMADRFREPSGRWVSYREIPGASFYFSAFLKRAVDPLKKVFGENVPGFITASNRLYGRKVETGDAGFEFNVFPRIPMCINLWKGDEEFPAEVTVLFDESIEDMLPSEDIAWMASMHVYRLIALSKE